MRWKFLVFLTFSFGCSGMAAEERPSAKVFQFPCDSQLPSEGGWSDSKSEGPAATPTFHSQMDPRIQVRADFVAFSQFMDSEAAKGGWDSEQIQKIGLAFEANSDLTILAFHWLAYARQQLVLPTPEQSKDPQFRPARAVSIHSAANVYYSLLNYSLSHLDSDAAQEFLIAYILGKYVDLIVPLTPMERSLIYNSGVGDISTDSTAFSERSLAFVLKMVDQHPGKVVQLLYHLHTKNVMTEKEPTLLSLQRAFKLPFDFSALGSFMWRFSSDAMDPKNTMDFRFPLAKAVRSLNAIKTLVDTEKALFPEAGMNSRYIALKIFENLTLAYYLYGEITLDGIVYERRAYDYVDSVRKYFGFPKSWAVPIKREATAAEKASGKPDILGHTDVQ